jgi:hypothetical protein
MIFLSYSHKDKNYLDLVRTHLKYLEDKYQMHIWDDQQIAPGARWRQAIETALAEASVAVLLVSADWSSLEVHRRDGTPGPAQSGAERKSHAALHRRASLRLRRNAPGAVPGVDRATRLDVQRQARADVEPDRQARNGSAAPGESGGKGIQPLTAFHEPREVSSVTTRCEWASGRSGASPSETLTSQWD